MDRISTGIDILDDLLQGGFPGNSTIMLVGSPGTGKTIMAHQMMFRNAAPEHKFIYMTTLAEPQVKVMKFQQEFSFFDESKFQRSVIYHDLGSVLRRSGPRQALVLIEELLKKHQPRVIIIDAIKSITDMLPSFMEFREFLLDLSLRLAAWGCTSLLLCEYSEEEIEIRPESAIADGIIYLSGTDEKKRQKRFMRIIKMRGTGYPGGEIMFKITGKGIEIFPRVNPTVRDQSYEQFEGRVSTGIRGLDEMMGGGIPSGTTTILSGSAGTGKTLIAMHFAHAGVRAGEPVVFVSYEENPREVVKRAANFGLDLRSHLDSGLFHQTHVSPIELDVDEHIFDVQTLVQETGAKRLVIDSISSFEIGMEDKIKYTDYIWALTDFFKMSGVNVFLTHEMRDSLHITGITKHGLSFVADNLLMLRFKEQGPYLKRYLRVVKMRDSRHKNEMREFWIGPGGVLFEEIREF